MESKKKIYSLHEKVAHYRRIVKQYDNEPNKYDNKHYMYAKGFITGINNTLPRFDYEFMGSAFMQGLNAYERSVYIESKRLENQRFRDLIARDNGRL